jgi:Ribonuclease G/E
MSKELVISATPHETRVAIVEDGLLCEIYIEREKEFALVGSLYKGRTQNPEVRATGRRGFCPVHDQWRRDP